MSSIGSHCCYPHLRARIPEVFVHLTYDSHRMHKLLSLHFHLISFASPQLTRNIDWIFTVPHTTESRRSRERIDVSNGTGRLLELWWRQCSTLEIITYDRQSLQLRMAII